MDKENMNKDLLDDDLLDDGDGIESIQNLRVISGNNDLKIKVLIILNIIVFLIFVVVFGVSKFFTISSKNSDLTLYENQYIDFVKQNILTKLSSIEDKEEFKFKQKGLSEEKNVKNMKSYINNDTVIFYEKRFKKEKFLKDQFNKFNSYINNSKKYQNLIVKHSYFPKDFSKMIEDIKIMPILLTLNSIKIYVVDYFYIQTGRFGDEILSSIINRSTFLGDYSYISSNELKQYLVEDIQKLRESGVYFYLKNIKFNYMYSEGNNLIDNYFVKNFYSRFTDVIDDRIKKIENKKNTVVKDKSNFIAKYIYLIKEVYSNTDKLFENDDLNSLPIKIKLLSYDPNNQTLSFNVNISLQDKYNSKTSVIEISTQLVTLLRESRLILGKNINIDEINVSKMNKIVGGSEIVFNTTSFQFQTSVQSDVNVEVEDLER